MTLTVDAPRAEASSTARGHVARTLAAADDVLVIANLLFWATTLTWGWGGRDARLLTWGALLLVPALLVVKPWRSLPSLVLLLPNLIAFGAVVVVLTAPTGWAGRHDAASYVYASQLFLLVAAWAAKPWRRTFLLLLIACAGAAEFVQGWLPFWGGQDPKALFQGTFYWHNQVGIYLAAGALAAAAVCCTPLPRPYQLLGWSLGPLCAAGVVFSTSRGALLALAAGCAVLLLALLLQPGRLGTLFRFVGAVGSWAGVTYLLSGPPFFGTRVPVGAGTAARSSSLEGNGMQRLEDWRRAVEIFQEWPVSGAGFLSFRSAAPQVTDLRDGVSVASAHNGFLQALADGGLILALPLWIGIGLVVLYALRRLPAAAARKDAATIGMTCVLLALVLHSGMDFDWNYPALLAMFGVAAGSVVARESTARSPRAAAPWLVVVLLLLSFTAASGWTGGYDRNVQVEVEQ